MSEYMGGLSPEEIDEYYQRLDAALTPDELSRYCAALEPVYPGYRNITPLYEQIHSSTLTSVQLQELRAISARYVIEATQLPPDTADEGRRRILARLLAVLPEYDAEESSGLQRRSESDGTMALLLDGVQIEHVEEVYKEIAPQVIRPAGVQWQHLAVDYVPPIDIPTDALTAVEPLDAVVDDDVISLERADDIIGYETLQVARRLGSKALHAVTGQIQKIEHKILKTAA